MVSLGIKYGDYFVVIVILQEYVHMVNKVKVQKGWIGKMFPQLSHNILCIVAQMYLKNKFLVII